MSTNDYALFIIASGNSLVSLTIYYIVIIELIIIELIIWLHMFTAT